MCGFNHSKWHHPAGNGIFLAVSPVLNCCVVEKNPTQLPRLVRRNATNFCFSSSKFPGKPLAGCQNCLTTRIQLTKEISTCDEPVLNLWLEEYLEAPQQWSFHSYWLGYIGDEILPSYIGIIKSHYKDPYQPRHSFQCMTDLSGQ